MDQRKTIDPTILVIFGATGNLSANYLLPALQHMNEKGVLPSTFRLVCVGRRDFTTNQFIDFIVQKSGSLKKLSKSNLTYFRANFDDPFSFIPLNKLLADQETPKHLCYNRLYYFATSPQYFASIAKMLQKAKLLESCPVHKRRVRILVEKPFGFNLRSAQALNKLLLRYFSEDEIYRIDHYLGKETVQNLMVVRFANTLFEPLWNKKFIDYLEITVMYEDKVGNRFYFDDTGMLKDAVQNHLLQMLALIAMDEPKELETELIREEKKKILKALRPFNAETISNRVIRAQYSTYQKEIGKPSQTETFVALKTFIDTPRWRGVPFYLRTGMGLSKKITEISIHFKELVRCLFQGCAANTLTFRIQPDESVYLRINTKIPGFGVELKQADLLFGYKETFEKELLPAYERLLLDFVQGDQRLFIRSDEIEAAWKFIDSITNNWNKKNCPLYFYQPGTSGPKAAEELIKRDKRQWHTT